MKLIMIAKIWMMNNKVILKKLKKKLINIWKMEKIIIKMI
jgi:hypothetical protein